MKIFPCPHCQKVVETQNDLPDQIIRCHECKKFIFLRRCKPTKMIWAHWVALVICVILGIFCLVGMVISKFSNAVE